MPLVTGEWTETASTIADIVVALFTVAATVGVFFLFDQVRLQRKQLHRDLENLYVERYWTVLDRLEATKSGSRERGRAVVAYLGLCEDQCDMRQQDRITDETWANWGPSIHSQLLIEEFASVMRKQPEDRLAHLRQMMVLGVAYDPTETPLRLRTKNGL